jgi:hypothetical protein
LPSCPHGLFALPAAPRLWHGQGTQMRLSSGGSRRSTASRSRG